MTLNPDRKHELDQAWIDSLLVEAANKSRAEEQARLQVLFSNSELNESTNVTVKRVSETLSLSKWVPLAIAASLVLATSLWWLFSGNGNQQAYAAVVRSMQATPMAREYLIHIRANSATGSTERSARLFLGSDNRFAVNHAGWLGGEVWFGDNGKKKWFVPRLGPAVMGGEWLLNKWMTKSDATTPYLYLNTILQRMSKGYELESLADESLPNTDNSESTVCDHIRGTMKHPLKSNSNPNAPATIELWADKESGMARRVKLNWQRAPSQVGPVEWTIDLQGFPELAADWFEPRGHTRPGQRIMEAKSEVEVDSSQENSLPEK